MFGTDVRELEEAERRVSMHPHAAPQRVRRATAGWSMLLWLVFASCDGSMASKPHAYDVEGKRLQISARAELGATRDEITLLVNGVVVASGPFGAPEAVGILLHGEYDGIPIDAHCAYRWRIGLHIGHRCEVYVQGDGPLVLDF